ncbi:sulfite exporter TauE/SafE family protein [Uliginosibacterium sp. 31-16]|uniref:sulfite exporter TauE/SafE family protein n=1 Tax=Uliginosibacterium sp. 31-16 TaxID=3068315 RepID=UPI00273FE51C|nr:sulfite exporter TauE/SafE family protein [Uliginosibacterium sp. 31-16]MDP5238984.1 sulfite exporter TauE/SafE family protein [Uliginosibacterium sp. 31-16]
MDLMYPVAGFAVGAIVGLTGVGGGSLMTPLLVLLFGVNPSVAVGTDLLYAAVTKSGGTLAHSLKGTVDWAITRALAYGSIPAAGLTLWLVHTFLPGGLGGAKDLISFALGIALLLTAVSLVFRKKLQAFAQKHAPGTPNPQRTFWLTVATGAILGALVSISSVGAGALGVTALFFLYPHLPAHRIVGSDIAHAVPLTLVAGIGHWILGSVDWFLLGSLLIGSLPGIWIGSHVSAKVPERVLRPILAGMLVLIGSKLIAA